MALGELSSGEEGLGALLDELEERALRAALDHLVEVAVHLARVAVAYVGIKT